MSGICGIVRFDKQIVKNHDIQKMLNSMENSGTDDEGVQINVNMGFGHKMLWTTPESKFESQPLINNNRSLMLTADARIDNREELFEKLNITNTSLENITDADLILHSYQKWEEDCPKYLIGDFAFSIWDDNKQKLFCARDHVGIKQFYYYKSDNEFIFSSEISPVFTNSTVLKTPNLTAIKHFLKSMAFKYEHTFFKNILRLPPAHSLIILNNEVKINRYWYPERIKINKSLTMEDASKKFNELFKKAVDARLRSAYPVGSHLSGGLDSSSVAAIACELKGKNALTAFSIHFGDMECDESKYSNSMIQKLGIKAIIIRGDKLNFKDTYTVDRYNKEFPDWPGSGLFIIELPMMEEAHKLNTRVMLTGQGGDHLFTGDIVMFVDYFKQMQWMKLYEELKYYGLTIKNFKNYVFLPILPKKVENILRFIFRKKKLKIDTETISQISLFDELENKKDYASMTHAQKEDLGVILGMGNAMWMSQSPSNLGGRYNIEYRHPFYDKRLIEFSLSLPPEMKFSKGVIKMVLRHSMGNRLVEIISQRNDKAEFSDFLKKQIDALPLENTYKLDKLVEYQLANEDKILNEYKLFKENKLEYMMFFWNKLVMDKWLCYNYKKNKEKESLNL